MPAQRLIICASPRAIGKCARAAKDLAALYTTYYPDDQVSLLRLSDLDIHPCVGCNTCREQGECFIHDGMDTVLASLASANSLVVISPIYFSGPPAGYKALLDRLQPHFWLETRKAPKKLATLVAIGDGGDPNGYDPLVTCTRSALAVAGYKLAQVQAYIATSSADIAREMANDLFSEGA